MTESNEAEDLAVLVQHSDGMPTSAEKKQVTLTYVKLTFVSRFLILW